MTYHILDTFLADNAAHAVQVSLKPVLCIDCNQYVPLGWVEFGLTVCPQATGHYKGHRGSTEAITSIKDIYYNHLAEAGMVDKRAQVQIVRLAGKRGYGYILFNALTSEIVEASSVSVYSTRGKAVAEARNRARALGFEHLVGDDKTSVYTSVEQFSARVQKAGV